MEFDMVVEMLKFIKEKYVMVIIFIGDDDFIVYNCVRVEVCFFMVKVLDKNYVKKNLLF